MEWVAYMYNQFKMLSLFYVKGKLKRPCYTLKINFFLKLDLQLPTKYAHNTYYFICKGKRLLEYYISVPDI